ncbi:hypothetical protein JOB18_003000 [Solea senegalensis]|uniref:Uncharacterized protein n=1 Tax=Solea senegalensis TaxID=28829 RepID=A0AAV6T359_SOLSE|nr:hypothetical protein JOB18_003000 [Solea senegalensis]
MEMLRCCFACLVLSGQKAVTTETDKVEPLSAGVGVVALLIWVFAGVADIPDADVLLAFTSAGALLLLVAVGAVVDDTVEVKVAIADAVVPFDVLALVGVAVIKAVVKMEDT